MILTLISLSFITAAWAQENSRGNTGEKARSYDDLARESATISKMSRREYKKTSHYKFFKHNEDLIDEYYERMEANAKKYKKMERVMKKPQYSDWSYFGHKRKPKKRPVGKRKYCEECGIVH